MAELTPQSLRAVLQQQREDAERAPRPAPGKPQPNDAAYARQMEDTWGKGHPVPAGYRGQPVAAPGPDGQEAPQAVPEWERLFQEPQPWPDDADPQASPARPVPPWQHATRNGREP